MKTQSILVLTIVTVLVFLVGLGFGGMPQCQIIDLGTLGGSHSEAFAINDANQVVGWSSTTDIDWTNSIHAFLWEDGMMTDLGTLGGSSSRAYGINNSRQVVGMAYTIDNDPTSRHAFLWRDGVMIDLGTLGSSVSGDDSEAYGINDANQVVGWSRTNTGDLHAFLWEDGVMTDLGILGGSGSYAYAINNAGQVVGRAYTAPPSQANHAFLWEDSVMKDLGTFNGGSESYAYAINRATYVLGWSKNASGNTRACIWDSNGSISSLGTLGGWTSEAYGINDANQVVGWALNALHDRRAFLYTDGLMVDLNQLLPEGSSWELMEARDINNNGQIVGWGFINGEAHAFLLTPVPGSPICLGRPAMDFNKDCRVDFQDFALFTQCWLDCNLDPQIACWE